MEATEDDRREGSSDVEIEMGRPQNILRIFYDGTEETGLQRAGWAFSGAWTVSLQVTMIKYYFLGWLLFY